MFLSSTKPLTLLINPSRLSLRVVQKCASGHPDLQEILRSLLDPEFAQRLRELK